MDDMVSDEFYQQLLTTLAVVPTRDGHHHRINGETLLGFCACNDLVVTNTCFPHKSIHKFIHGFKMVTAPGLDGLLTMFWRTVIFIPALWMRASSIVLKFSLMMS